MAEEKETKISNVAELAKELGNNVGDEIEKSFNKAQLQQAVLAANEKVLGIEKMREDAIHQKQMLEAISGIKPEVTIVAEEEDSASWLEWILTALGLTGAAAAGLAAGLLAGWVSFIGSLLKRLGKLFNLDKIKMPKFLDDFFKAFTKEGKIGKKIIGIIDDFKMPKFLDDFFKAFTKEGKIGKKIIGIIDDFKMPKFLDDFFKAFTKEGKLVKKIMGIIDNFKMPKFTFITKITDFLKSTDKFKEISKAIDGVKDLFPKGKGGGTLGKFFNGIGDVFKPLGKIGDALSKPFKVISGLLGSGKEGSGILKSMSAFLKGGMIGKVFKAFARVGKAIAAPLTIIMGIIDGFFEAKDAVSKSEGIMATMVNTVVGAIGGFIDGAVFQLLDLLKSGVSWIAGFFGFTEVEKFLDSFSFSDMFNEFLDDIYAWFNLLFSDPVAALTNLVANYFGANLAIADFIVDMLKKPIVWIMELFGWDDAAAATESFSFSGTVMKVFDAAMEWINKLFTDPIGALTELLSGYFGAYLDIASWLVDMIKKPIVWLLGLFGWDDAAAATEKFSFKDTVMNVFNSAITWIKGLFSDPVKGLTDLLATIAGGYGTFLDFITAPLKKGIAWVLRLFGWDEAAEKTETFSFKDTIMGVFDKAVAWVKSLFSWSQEPVKEDDSFIVKTVKGVVQTVKDWFGSMFKFDSTSDIIASLVNVVTWLPNLVAKGITAVTAWFLKLLGFEEKSKAVAEAGKKFSFGDLLMGAVDSLVKWFTKLFDLDVEAIVKSIPGGAALWKIFGSGEGAKQREELEAAGLKQGKLDFGQWDVDIAELREKMKGMGTEQMELMIKNMQGLAAGGQIANTEEVANVFQEMMSKAEKSHTGSILKSGGLILAEKGEVIVDDLLVRGLQKSIALLTNSQALEQQKNSGAPIVINNIDQSQKTQTNMNRTQNLNVGSNSPHNENSTLAVMN